MTKDEYKGLLERGSPSFQNANKDNSQVSDPKPERHKKATLDRAVQGEMESHRRVTVRFTGYRLRPCDPDNFAGSCKDLLDGLRHAGLISGDEPWKIIFQTKQEKVGSSTEERTEIEIIYP
jgi:hypothetical protein